jgi:putative flippase GtrA
MNRFLRYCAVGALATAVHYALLVAGVALAGWPAWVCAGIGAIVGAQVAFVGNSRYTFSGAARGAAPWIRFQATAVIGSLVSMAVVAAAVRLGWHYLLGQVLATGLALLLTFGINRRWTFA